MKFGIFLLVLFFSLSTTKLHCQTDNVGSGRALQFDGVSSYVKMGDHYHDLNLPFTVSAWVYMDPNFTGGTPIMVTNDNNPIYRGFWFFMSRTNLWCEFGDGTGGFDPAYRRGKNATIPDFRGRWVNVTAVMTSATNIQLYINGIDVGGNPSGASSLSMASSYPGDTPKIGYFLSNGIYYYHKGMIDEVRLWKRSLTQEEVRQQMCVRLKENEPGLIGYWNFDETSGNTIFDKSPNGFNGTLMNNVQRVYSSAPIGDFSAYQYSSNFTGTTVSLSNGKQKLDVSDISGAPEGVQIYSVNSLPSQRGGLDISQVSPLYFGVFMASLDANNTFTANLSSDNSVPIAGLLQQQEIIFNMAGANIPKPNLGPDISVCDASQYFLDSHVDANSYSLNWSTGATSQGITVNQSGLYWVEVQGGCKSPRDSILVSFFSLPPAFSLGEDESVCILEPRLLKPFDNPSGFNFTWQDGSLQSSYQVKDYGVYWVKVENKCGAVTDTLRLTKPQLNVSRVPNVITPNGDSLNDYFVVQDDLVGQLNFQVFNRWGEPVFQESNYNNNWDGNGLASGVYYAILSASCIGVYKTPLTIIR